MYIHFFKIICSNVMNFLATFSPTISEIPRCIATYFFLYKVPRVVSSEILLW